MTNETPETAPGTAPETPAAPSPATAPAQLPPVPAVAQTVLGTPPSEQAAASPLGASRAGEPQPGDPTPADLPPQEPPPAPAYTEFKLPDGVVVDDAALKAATDLFKEARLPQEQAQRFIDLAASREQAAAQKGVQAFVDLQNKWVSEIKADPDIGGDKLDASLASAARAIDRLGVPGLREALNLTGAGNNPAVVKAFVRLGQMVSEDRFRPGRDAPPEPPKSPAEKIYGASGPKQSLDI